MNKICASIKELIIVITSIITGVFIIIFIQNDHHENFIWQSKKDVSSVTEEINFNLIQYDNLLYSIRAFIYTHDIVSKELFNNYISHLTLEKNGIQSMHYVAFNKGVYICDIALNNHLCVQKDKNYQLNYQLINENNKLNIIKTKIINNKLIINLPLLSNIKSEQKTIGVIILVLDNKASFAILRKPYNNLSYRILDKDKKSIIFEYNFENLSKKNKNKNDYYEELINWHDITFLNRVYIENPDYWEVSKKELLISMGIALLIYLIINTFLYLIRTKTKAYLLASEISKEIKHLNWHDSLTQLYNRNKITEELDLKINSLVDKNHRLFIFSLDLQGFKRINDEFGHSVGDLVLKEYSNRLVKSVPNVFEVVARANGDEFLIFIDSDKINNLNFLEQIKYLNNELDKIIKLNFVVNEEQFLIQHKIGISIYPDHGRVAEDLFKYAELAMYEAKFNEETIFVYQNNLAKKLIILNKMKTSLSLGLENNEFYLVYQPKVTVDINGTIKDSAEVLCRWNSPVFGLVSPDVFINLAEETGDIHKLGTWVMEESIKQLHQWNNLGFNITLSINLSPKQLMNNNLAYEFNQFVIKNNISPSQVSLEMTENSMIFDTEKSKLILKEFHDYGFKISIDDFGKGYSSLSYLKDYPISEIKMDKSFIDDIVYNQFNQILVEGIILVSSKLGIDLVIEGVESLEQKEFLIKMGCNKFQGYYFSRPLSAKDLEKYLNN